MSGRRISRSLVIAGRRLERWQRALLVVIRRREQNIYAALRDGARRGHNVQPITVGEANAVEKSRATT